MHRKQQHDSTAAPHATVRVLVVAYGNPLRSDDGLAWRTADELQRRCAVPGLEILRRHQLAPEIAADLSRCGTVVFVDAAVPGAATGIPGEVRLEELPEQGEPIGEMRCSHQFSPATLIRMAEQLYGTRPRAYCATLTGQNFDHGESFSPPVEASLPQLVARIADLVQRIACDEAR